MNRLRRWLNEWMQERVAKTPCCGEFAACMRSCVERGRWLEQQDQRSKKSLAQKAAWARRKNMQAFEGIMANLGSEQDTAAQAPEPATLGASSQNAGPPALAVPDPRMVTCGYCGLRVYPEQQCWSDGMAKKCSRIRIAKAVPDLQSIVTTSDKDWHGPYVLPNCSGSITDHSLDHLGAIRPDKSIAQKDYGQEHLEDEAAIREQQEDDRLNDPRHGQAKDINRRN